jgi:hypothetical protein
VGVTPLRALLLIGSQVQLPGGTILSHVAWQSTLETRNKSLTSLRGGILLVLGCRTRNMLYILPRLLHNWTSCLLLWMEHWISGMLHLKVGMRDLYRCMTREWDSDKLTGLQKAGPSVASGMQAEKHHLAFAILLHLFHLILDDDGLVNQMLKIWVVSVEQLKLDLVIETLQKCILLLIGADVIGGVP